VDGTFFGLASVTDVPDIGQLLWAQTQNAKCIERGNTIFLIQAVLLL